jgi:hypothetical protein
VWVLEGRFAGWGFVGAGLDGRGVIGGREEGRRREKGEGEGEGGGERWNGREFI